jgi:PAS domain S-box-containing protein
MRGATLPASWSFWPSGEAQHYRILFERAPDGHLLTDGVGRILEANALAGSLLGAPPEALRDRPLVVFVSPEQRRFFATRLSRLGPTGSGAPEEWEVRMSDGKGGCFEAALAVTLLPEPDFGGSRLWSLRDISGRKRTEARLKESERRHRRLYRQLLVQRDRLRFLSARCLHAREDEAQRIAHQLHDEAAQMTAVAHLTLDEISRRLPRRLAARLHTVRAVLDGLEDRLRHISHELRPTLLDDMGLLPALGFLAEGFSARTGIPVEVEGDLGQERLEPLVETALYRIIQEALANVGRHAQATQVWVGFEHRKGALRCRVKDDGVGFDPEAGGGRAGGLGLLGIRERLAGLGGRLEVASSCGKGTQLVAHVPLVARGSTRSVVSPLSRRPSGDTAPRRRS